VYAVLRIARWVPGGEPRGPGSRSRTALAEPPGGRRGRGRSSLGLRGTAPRHPGWDGRTALSCEEATVYASDTPGPRISPLTTEPSTSAEARAVRPHCGGHLDTTTVIGRQDTVESVAPHAGLGHRRELPGRAAPADHLEHQLHDRPQRRGGRGRPRSRLRHTCALSGWSRPRDRWCCCPCGCAFPAERVAELAAVVGPEDRVRRADQSTGRVTYRRSFARKRLLPTGAGAGAGAFERRCRICNASRSMPCQGAYPAPSGLSEFCLGEAGCGRVGLIAVPVR
jgi:hypothetical protein